MELETDPPPEVAHLWRWFLHLSNRRQSGMAANPISYQEVEALCRRRLVEFTAWEVALLMRLDDAILAIWAEKAAKDKPGADGAIPASDTKSVRSMLQGLAARKAQA